MNTSAIKEPGHWTCATQHTIIVTLTLNWYHFRKFRVSIPLLRKTEAFWDASCSVSPNLHIWVFDLAECIPHPSVCLWMCLYFVEALHNVDTWRRDLVVRDLWYIVIGTIIFPQLCYARGVNAVVHKHATRRQWSRVLNQKMSHIDHYRFKVLTTVSNDSRWLRVQNKSERDGLNLNESWHRGHSFTYNTHVRLQRSYRIPHPRLQKKRNSDFVNEFQGC